MHTTCLRQEAVERGPELDLACQFCSALVCLGGRNAGPIMTGRQAQPPLGVTSGTERCGVKLCVIAREIAPPTKPLNTSLMAITSREFSRSVGKS